MCTLEPIHILRSGPSWTFKQSRPFCGASCREHVETNLSPPCVSQRPPPATDTTFRFSLAFGPRIHKSASNVCIGPPSLWSLLSGCLTQLKAWPDRACSVQPVVLPGEGQSGQAGPVASAKVRAPTQDAGPVGSRHTWVCGDRFPQTQRDSHHSYVMQPGSHISTSRHF